MAVKQRTNRPSGRRPLQPDPTVPSAGRKLRTKVDKTSVFNMGSFIKGQPVWIVLAVASGACAAINGVFAKLTTTSLTGSLAIRLSTLLGLPPDNNAINVALRGTFFGLNLLFNAIMWALFTKALTKGNSTTRVSIVNVSANFFITAMLGWAIFGEKLPIQWWMGAGLLAVGNVVIGRREEGENKTGNLDQGEGGQNTSLMDEDGQEDLIELDGPSGRRTRSSIEEDGRVKRGEEVDAPL